MFHIMLVHKAGAEFERDCPVAVEMHKFAVFKRNKSCILHCVRTVLRRNGNAYFFILVKYMKFFHIDDVIIYCMFFRH